MIEIPAEPAAADNLPPLLKGFGAVPPLVTDINLSLDDRFLYVSCWGTGELRQYDVSDPFNPVETGSVKIGGIVRRQAHPARPEIPLNGGPQMVEVSRDGRALPHKLPVSGLGRTVLSGRYPWLDGEAGSPDGGLELDRNASFSSTICGPTRFIWKAATPLPIPTASLEGRHDDRNDDVVRAMLSASAPFTASIRAWAGFSPWLSGCRSAGAAP